MSPPGRPKGETAGHQPEARLASAQLDHLVVAAATLEQGVQWCRATLGVTPATGGRHALMGTRNRLLSIVAPAFPLAYLEIIAVDPDAPAPARRRWFGLDDPALRKQLAGAPRLMHAVARTTALDAQRAALMALGTDPGVALSAGRDTPVGPLRWRILVRDDGVLPYGGALPTLIEWQGRHPAAALPASDVALESLELAGLPAAVWQALKLDAVACVDAAGATPALTARLRTPRGLVVLQSGPVSAAAPP